jgi:ACT domain-containing protein
MDPKYDQLIFSLLKHRTKEEAAHAAGISRATLYRYIADPVFKAAYSTALRGRFQDCLATLEKNADRSAQALVDVVDDPNVDVTIRVIAAKAVIDRALKAHVTIAVEEEQAELRELMATIKAGALPAPILVVDPSNEEIHMAEDEQAEASRLRVAWMTEVGFDGHQIADSLRFNRPQLVEEESYYLEAVRKILEHEAAQEAFVRENA